MSRFLNWALLLTLAGLPACQSPLSPNEREELREAEARWGARGFADYSIETRSSCFCVTEVLGWVRIEVAGGDVVRATILESGEVITDERLQFWTTVEELFVSLHRSNDEDYLTDVRMEFDDELGFPTQVEWVPDESVQDAGGSRSLRNAQPLD